MVLPLEEPKGLSLLELSQEQTRAIRKSCVCCRYLWVSYAAPKHLRALARHPAHHPPCCAVKFSQTGTSQDFGKQ